MTSVTPANKWMGGRPDVYGEGSPFCCAGRMNLGRVGRRVWCTARPNTGLEKACDKGIQGAVRSRLGIGGTEEEEVEVLDERYGQVMMGSGFFSA